MNSHVDKTQDTKVQKKITKKVPRKIETMRLETHPLFLGWFFSYVFVCYSARVKHSEYEKTWRIPDDDEADWPSPDQIYFDLGESLDGMT